MNEEILEKHIDLLLSEYNVHHILKVLFLTLERRAIFDESQITRDHRSREASAVLRILDRLEVQDWKP